MRYLLLVSWVLALACSSAYKGQRTPATGNCITSFQPRFSRVLYNTQVEVTGRHLSGLLIIKTMPDSSTRMVFANEAGFKFFDFEFREEGFTVHHIMAQMDRKAVIKTLRKDFELILMQHTGTITPAVIKKDSEYYYDFAKGKDHYYYITDSACSRLLRLERGSKRKKVTEAYLGAYTENMPDTIGIRHTNFNFTITLKRLDEHASE